MMEAGMYLRSLFDDKMVVIFGAVWATICKLVFPDRSYMLAAGAVLIVMCVDLLTKLYSLSRQSGGTRKAVRSHTITSGKFAKGTMDKLLVFGIMLIICGAAYRISPINGLAVWFTQLIFTIMFLRDVLSIVENLTDAGVGGLSIFKKAIKKKMDDYTEEVTGEKENSADSGRDT